MLVIRESQMATLAEERFVQLKQWLPGHLRQHFEEELAGKDDHALAAFANDSVDRARAHGVSQSAAICKFVHLRVLFGDDLESLPWAARVLTDASITDADARMDALSRAAEPHL